MYKLCVAVACLWVMAGIGRAQEPGPMEDSHYSRLNTFSVFTEYSPTSSHILLGQSRNRILVSAGGSYTRRLLKTENTAFSYVFEIHPVTFVADPVALETYSETVLTGPYAGQTFSGTSSEATVLKCQRSVYSGTVGFPGNPPEEYSYTQVDRCGWRWTYGQSAFPAAMKYSFRTRRTLQPYATAFGGYMFSTRPVPNEDAEAFNFVFGAGVGMEMYRSRTRSLSVEARYQHFSNKNTAPANPGVDNIMYRLSYSFGH